MNGDERVERVTIAIRARSVGNGGVEVANWRRRRQKASSKTAVLTSPHASRAPPLLVIFD